MSESSRWETARLQLPRGGAADRCLDILTWSAALSVIGLFLWITADLFRGGFALISPAFLGGSPINARGDGGIAPILVSTAAIVGVCLAVALPIGLGTALLLAEAASEGRRFTRIVGRSLDILAGMPSIVLGLFGSVLFCRVLGLGFSILAGGLTLACMVLPIFIRAAESGLRAVPEAQRQAAAALGLSRWTRLFRVWVPAARPALVVGFVLGLGRAAAETAALLFTSGSVTRMPESWFDSGRALSVHVYELAMHANGGEANAHASALVLVALLLVINGFAAWVLQHSSRQHAGSA